MKMRSVGRWVAGSLMMAIPAIANACPVCFGDPSSPLTKGAPNAVWFLLGVIGFVQIGLGGLFITFWRRAKARSRFRDQFHVIEGGVR